MIFTRRYRFRFGDIDDAGIAYYPAMFHYVHCAMEDWWQDGLGMPYATLLHDEKVGFPAVHLESDFLAPIRYGDEPDIHLGVLRVGGRSLELGVWMTRSDRPLCRVNVTTACVDMETLRGRDVPERWRRAFGDWSITAADMPARR